MDNTGGILHSRTPCRSANLATACCGICLTWETCPRSGGNAAPYVGVSSPGGALKPEEAAVNASSPAFLAALGKALAAQSDGQQQSQRPVRRC